jgi:two-component system sensor histidine kinase/response regulator
MTRSRGGSGLGLAIAKRLFELKGGKIGVESKLGRGSRFHFTALYRRIAGAAGAPHHARYIARPLRTLLVDTSAVSARVTRQYLANWKILPTVVNTVHEAEMAWEDAVAAGTEFDVAILDLKGLGADGVDLARRIRTERQSGRTEIILLVGVNNLAADDDLETLGAFATLTKPARPSALFDCFASIAANAGDKGIAPLVVRHNGRGVMPSFDARVLVVEDNAVNQEVATGVLENMDCQVVTAANGSCAVDLFGRANFDLILMDCEMPVMNGFEATRRIRAIEVESAPSNGSKEAGRIPIVALTAHALAEIREECLRSGMDDFLVKPFDELQIGEMLRRWIPSRERLRAKSPVAERRAKKRRKTATLICRQP